MPRNPSQGALLLADIAGSTPLYERIGDVAAGRKIGRCLAALKSIAEEEEGTFIRSRGDDVLCTFAHPSPALKAARRMLSLQAAGPLAIHAGGHFGRIIHTSEDLFGDAVNLTARLAALAKPGEILVSRSFFDRLAEPEAHIFRLLDCMMFKGKMAPAEVYSLVEDDRIARTEIVLSPRAAARLVLLLRYRETSRECAEEASVSIGRAPDCDLVIAKPWISRWHATVAVRRGKVQLEDRSASGTYVTMADGQELFLHRESILLSGQGTISPAIRQGEPGAEVVHYCVEASPIRCR
jgi:adenylate cyclase